MRKVLSISFVILIIISLFSFLSFETFAKNIDLASEEIADYTYKVVSGKAEITSCNIASTGVVVVPSMLDNYEVASIGEQAFLDCNFSLVVLPDTLQRINKYAFYNCKNLVEISIPKNVELVYSTSFMGCKSLNTIKVDTNNKHFYSVDGVLYSKDYYSLVLYPLGKRNSFFAVPDNIDAIEDFAFYDNTNIIKLNTGENNETISSKAFCGMNNLSELVLGKNAKIIEKEAFKDSKLSKVTLNEGLEEINECAFLNCTFLKNIDIPKSVSKIQSYALGYYQDSLDLNYYLYDSLIMSGYYGSEAHKYANKNLINFNGYSDGPEIYNIALMTGNRVTLYWNMYEDASQYRVYYKRLTSTTWKALKDVYGVSYVDTNLADDVTYCYAIAALDSSGREINDYKDVVSTIHFHAAPKLISTAMTAKGPRFSWNPVKGINYYKVYYSDNGGSWIVGGIVSNTSFVLENAQNGHEYTFTVRCMDDNQMDLVSSYESPGLITKFYNTPNMKPLEVVSRNGNIRISWNSVSGVSTDKNVEYAIYYKRTDKVSNWKLITTTNNTYFIDSGCVTNKTYIYAVQLYNINTKRTVSYFQEKTINYFISTPLMHNVEQLDYDGHVKISWDKVPEIDLNSNYAYAVYYKRLDKNMNWVLLTTTKDLSYEDFGCSFGKTYVYAVQCFNISTKKTISNYQEKKIKYLCETPIMNEPEIVDNYGHVKLTWNSVDAVSSNSNYAYAIYYKRSDSSMNWVLLTTVQTTSYIDSGCVKGKNYIYAVSCYDLVSKSNISSYQTKNILYSFSN